MFEDIELEPEQITLFITLFEIIRDLPREQKIHFYGSNILDGTTIVIHPSSRSNQIITLPRDIETLNNEGLIDRSFIDQYSFTFFITNKGGQYYQYLQSTGITRIVPPPTPTVTTSTVERALKDAENLLKSSGAASAVDRVHTALHGYLRAVLDKSLISYSRNATITELYSLLRNSHTKFQTPSAHDKDVLIILRAITKILDSLNTIRNQASVAHPNPILLDEPEAILAINSVRTLLHYLDSKLK